MTEPPAKTMLNISLNCKNKLNFSYKTAHPKATQDNIASHFSKEWGKTIGRSTISDILKEQDKWVNAGKNEE